MLEGLEVKEERGYLHITFSGTFSLSAAKRCVDEMVEASEERRCSNIMFDCRPMTGDMPIIERFEVGVYGSKTIPRNIRVAMLGREDQLLPDDFFGKVSRNRGLILKVFSDIGEAIKWLTESTSASSERA